MNKTPQSAGATIGQTSGLTGALITILMFFAHHYGWDNFTLEVASAFITVGGVLVGLAVHHTICNPKAITNEEVPLSPVP